MLDIIIPHHNRSDLLQRCLKSIPISKEYNVRVVRSGGTFAENCNIGSAETHSDNILFLNDDTVISEKALIEFIDSDNDITGAPFIYPDNRPQSVGITIDVTEDSISYRLTLDEIERVYPSGAAFCIKRSVFQEIGGFDESYRNGAEDRELFHTAIERGFTFGYIKTPIMHHMSQSEGRFTYAGQNDDIFNERWSSERIKNIITISKEMKKRDFPLISVIIPSRPTEDFACIPYIESQTYPNIEVIKVVDEELRGAPWARNKGFEQSSGEYVFFCDNDLELEKNALFNLYSALTSYKKCNVKWAYGWFTVNGQPRCVNKQYFVNRYNFPGFFEGISIGSLITRDAFPYFDESLKRFQDFDLYIHMHVNGHQGMYVNKKIFNTPIRENGISTDKNIPAKEARKILFDKWKNKYNG